jgi:hypothetical protein
VVDVEHRGLAGLEHQRLPRVQRLVQHERGVRDVGAEPLGEAQQVLDGLVDRDRAPVVDLHQQVVLLVEGALDLLPQDVLVEQVLDADADAVDLVRVRRADAAAGRADLPLAEEPLGDLVDRAVVRGDDVRGGRHQQPLRGDPAGLQGVDLAEQHLEVDDDAVADDGRDAGRQDARGQQVQGVLLAPDDDRVPGVVPAVELHDVVDPRAELVGRLALALVTPLGPEHHDGRHVITTPTLPRDGTPVRARGGR